LTTFVLLRGVFVTFAFLQLAARDGEVRNALDNVKELTDALVECERERNVCQTQLVSANAELATARSEAARCKADVAAARDQLITLGEHASSLAQARKAALASNDALKAENAKLANSVTDMQARAEVFEQETGKLRISVGRVGTLEV
jgi:uncharacterized protein (DUF3084 family)